MAPTSCKGSTPCQIIVPNVCTTPTQAIQLSHNADTRTNHVVPPFYFRVLCGIFFWSSSPLFTAIYSLFSQPSSCFSWLVPPLVNNFYSLFPCHSLNDYLSAEVLRQCEINLMSRLTSRPLWLAESKWNNTVDVFVCFWLWSQRNNKMMFATSVG